MKGIKVKKNAFKLPASYRPLQKYEKYIEKIERRRKRKPCVGLCHLNRIAKSKVRLSQF